MSTARTLVLTTVLLAGCMSTDPPVTNVDSPTIASDPAAAAACDMAVRAAEEQVSGKQLAAILGSIGAAQRAVLSADPDLNEAGRRLLPIGKRTGEFLVKDRASAEDMKLHMQQLDEARRDLLSARTNRFGTRPWAFTNQPSPDVGI